MHTRIAALAAALVTAAPLVLTATVTTTAAAAADPAAPTRITLTTWDDRADFASGVGQGIDSHGKALTIDKKAHLPTLSYVDPFGDGSARTYEYATWTSPVVELDYADDEAISSWNAETPTGTWVETQFRGRHTDGSWTKWYVMGRWTSGMDYANGDIHRTSLNGQNDTDARILTDTFSSRTGREPVAFQTRCCCSARRREGQPQARRDLDDDQRADPRLQRGHEHLHAGPPGRAVGAGVRPEHPLG